MPRKRNNLQTELLTSIQLVKEADFRNRKISLFDCGHQDLNDFIRNDAWHYKKHLLAETYLIYPTETYKKRKRDPIAFISLCNDSIPMEIEERKGDKKPFFKAAIQKNLPNKKRFFQSYPAVKIARLGVSVNSQGGGVGSGILNMFKRLFLTNNRTGCLFITVDANNIPETIKFYKKNGFITLWPKDRKHKTRIMWFDLSNHLITND